MKKVRYFTTPEGMGRFSDLLIPIRYVLTCHIAYIDGILFKDVTDPGFMMSKTLP